MTVLSVSLVEVDPMIDSEVDVLADSDADSLPGEPPTPRSDDVWLSDEVWLVVPDALVVDSLMDTEPDAELDSLTDSETD